MAIVAPRLRKLALLALLTAILPVLAVAAMEARKMPHRLRTISTDVVAGVAAGMMQARQELQER
jgi:hypothetical protein